MPDHVHMLVSIPPKYSVAEVIGFIKGQELDLDRAEYRAKSEELHRTQVLGTRIFRFDGGPGRGDDPRLHQEPGASGLPNGSTCADPIVPSQK